MLSSLLGSARRPSSTDASLRSPAARTRSHHDQEREGLLAGGREYTRFDGEDGSSDGDAEDELLSGEDEVDGHRPLLPIFDASRLDRIPIYSTTHAVRQLIVQRVETTLSWDQLRSPQVSQFLVKPIQRRILDAHFSSATLYMLMANCLQFKKEMQQCPGLVGVNRTRAMICELLAMRLLKEYSARELIDALSYDFDPLQDSNTPLNTGVSTPHVNRVNPPRPARISTIEVAIRAQAKRLIAHPLVVQQLEAIWAGTIVFHSAADSLHRTPAERERERRQRAASLLSHRFSFGTFQGEVGRMDLPRDVDGLKFLAKRAVTIYDFRNASLFKLSRLRVGRYRQFFTTCSFGVMLVLLVAILARRSQHITAMEVVFWFFSAGFMLAEVAEFTEQGSGLFFMSFWNVFDILSAVLFIVYYVLRLYGQFLPSNQRRENGKMAHDVLATTAVLLFPRLFSVLDHYYYFSQLLIALRAMAWDLVAVMILIIISCSGFFVAFTFSLSDVDFHARDAGYVLFQILMGFTPAAWNLWPNLNPLSKSTMVLFLIICHFLVVTVLITVLTNSFMAVVQNAQEEHQFLFAVNTMSMVKSDAMFSYIPPMNLVGWVLAPLRYALPLRRFVKVNRTIIKITHFPILFSIFAYERLFLARLAFVPMDLVESQDQKQIRMPAFSTRGRSDGLSLRHRVREPSVATFRKDQALAAVFRHPYSGVGGGHEEEGSTTLRTKTQTVVQDWMHGIGQSGASPPQEEARSLLDRLETKRPKLRRMKTGPARRLAPPRGLVSRSFTSNPHDALSRISQVHPIEEEDEPGFDTAMDDIIRQTDQDAEGDDEAGSDDDGIEDSAKGSPALVRQSKLGSVSPIQGPISVTQEEEPLLDHPSRLVRNHDRNPSTTTILYNPRPSGESKTAPVSRSTSPHKRLNPARTRGAGSSTPGGRLRSGHRTSRRVPVVPSNTPAVSIGPARSRSILPPDGRRPPSSNLVEFLALERRLPSFNAMALDLASDLGDNRYGPDVHVVGAMPASFSTQMEALAAMRRTRIPLARDTLASDGNGHSGGSDDRQREWQRERAKERKERRRDEERMSRIMLARMTTLEEGFREVLKEVKGWKKEGEAQSGATSIKSVDGAGSRRTSSRHGKARVDAANRVGSERGAELDGQADADLDRDRPSV